MLDASGREYVPEETYCQKCGKNESEIPKTKGFGGYWKMICECGETLKEGRER